MIILALQIRVVNTLLTVDTEAAGTDSNLDTISDKKKTDQENLIYKPKSLYIGTICKKNKFPESFFSLIKRFLYR